MKSESGHVEADIVINGKPLTFGQSMTLRVAVQHMLMDMLDPKALGDDAHGRAMTAGYRAMLIEIQDLISGHLR